MKNEPLPERNGPASALSHLHFCHHSGPHGELHHLREDLDLLDEVPDEFVVVCQGITLAGLQLFAEGYMIIKFSLSCNAFAPSCAKYTPLVGFAPSNFSGSKSIAELYHSLHFAFIYLIDLLPINVRSLLTSCGV